MNQHPDHRDLRSTMMPTEPVRSWLARRHWVRWGVVGAGVAALTLSTGCTAKVENDVLTVTGVSGNETIALRLQAGDPNNLEVDWNADGTAEYTFARDTFSRIDVDMAGGNDRIVIDQSNGVFTDTEITTLRGGDGNDTLVGGFGVETLDGGPGDDVMEGNQGADVIIGGTGADVVQWDPGDGSDVVDGGAGVDRLAFNGSAASESFAFAPVGDRVRFTRNVAAITMDLDGVETVDLETFSGTDVVQVASVAGTDLTTITTDLAAIGGGDDGAVDEVLVPPGSPIGRDGPAATVDGLGAQVRVVGGAATDRIHVVGAAATDVAPVRGTASADAINVAASGTDVVVSGATPGASVLLSGVPRLDVDLLGGADTFSAVGNLAPLTTLDVDGGAGADAITGGNGADWLDGGDDADFVDGNQGNDVLVGGTGDDVIQWDPGDGSDVVDGGANADQLVFNGSNANENMAVAAVGDHVRFTRDVGAITMDVDGIEAMDVRTLGGIDVVRVDTTAGTDLTTFTTDFAAVGGGDDGQVDEVVVPPGVPIGRDGSAGTVGGLGAQVRVVNGSPTDQIHVAGTAGVDGVPVTATSAADAIQVVANGTEAVVVGATSGVSIGLEAIELLHVDLLGGDDSFSAIGNLATLTTEVDGGPGADTITGGNGNDVLMGGDDADFLDGNQGADVLVGGAGADVVQWDPGDGNDIVSGGPGVDRMAFNGSNANESFVIAPVADHVRLTRNIGNIVLDLDDVETLDLRTLGGTDVVQLDSVAGTDLTTINGDLASSTGVPDAVADQVVVNGTTGDDTIAVAANGSVVEATGLAALVRVTGADPLLDRLTVNGLAGTDAITASPAAGSLILLELFP